MNGSTSLLTTNRANDSKESTDQLWDLLRKSDRGDRSSLVALQRALQGPQGDLLIKACGDLANQAELNVLDATIEDKPGTKTIIRETLNRMRFDLGWRESPRIEQLLIERVVLTWLHLHLAEMTRAQREDQSQRLKRYLDERIDRLNKRYLASIKTLATVRKLTSGVIEARLR